MKIALGANQFRNVSYTFATQALKLSRKRIEQIKKQKANS